MRVDLSQGLGKSQLDPTCSGFYIDNDWASIRHQQVIRDGMCLRGCSLTPGSEKKRLGDDMSPTSVEVSKQQARQLKSATRR